MITNVGLLLPRSVIYPSMNFDLANGLKYGLADNGIKDVTIKAENIGIAADDKLIYGACEKLLFEGCTIVAGYVNAKTAESLQGLFASANAIFIALDSGYHYPTSMAKLPNVFYLSLQGTLCCRLTAKIAQQDGKKNFAFTGSFYDAGYRSIHAFCRNVEEEGGSITFNHITKLKRSEFTLEPLANHLAEPAADAVLASFCGDMMQDFFVAAANGNVFEKHPVYASPFMGEEQWLAQSPYPGADMKTCVTWASKLDNEANKHFMETMAANKQRSNIFSELGWEASLLIATSIATGDIADSIKALEGMQYNSPRGRVTVDADTHQCYAPVYEALIQKDDMTGNCILVPLRESQYTEQQRKQLEKDINNFTGPATSWQNAYACLDS